MLLAGCEEGCWLAMKFGWVYLIAWASCVPRELWMGKARCGGLLFCVPALLLAGHDLTPESCICKMLSPYESKGSRMVFAVDGRSQTHGNCHTTANNSVKNMKPWGQQG